MSLIDPNRFNVSDIQQEAQNYYGNQTPSVNAGPSQDVWNGIDPRLVQLYQSHGINAPGAAGSGFTDANYWNNDAVRNANGDWGYVLDRLNKDLSGNGVDAPGPGDKGNTSGQQGNGQMMGNWLQSLLGLLKNQNPGAQPYNPNQQHLMNNTSNYFQNRGYQPSGSTNGTLLGTSVNSSGGAIGMSKPTATPMNVGQRQSNNYSWMGGTSAQQNPMGAPSFYKNPNPIPNNNFGQ